MSSHRLSQFSDGIFAISATLLVLNFVVPTLSTPNNAMLMRSLMAEWPKLLAFLLSFGVVTNYWRVHSALFSGVMQTDHRTIMLNVTWLVAAAFVPYATNVAGAYPTLPAAAVLYSLTLLVPAIAALALSDHLLKTDAYGGVVPASAKEAYARVKVAVYIRLAGLAFAFILPVISYAIYWVVIVYYVFIGGLDVSPAERESMQRATRAD
jgi:uncharacterized membrane protein